MGIGIDPSTKISVIYKEPVLIRHQKLGRKYLNIQVFSRLEIHDLHNEVTYLKLMQSFFSAVY